MKLEPGTPVRWHRDTGHRRVSILPAVVVRLAGAKSAVIRTQDDWQHTVRVASLMPAAPAPG